MSFATIPAALAALRDGRPVLVLDDVDRENEGDVILAAQTLTDEWVAWAIRHTSGYLCAPLPEENADALALPLMVADNQDSLRTAYTVTVDAAHGVSTGISAADRAHTLRVLAAPDSTPADLIRPGHVVPLRARAGGVFTRRGHTEAGVDLCRLAGLAPVAAIAELVCDDGSMLRTPGVLDLAHRHHLPVITIEELVAWRDRHDRVRRGATGALPARQGEFTMTAYLDQRTGAEHLALTSPHGVGEHPVVRIHSECLTGDAFGSARCDCGPQLDDALQRIAREPGAVIYLRGHEGRGVGLANKVAAYQHQDGGLDTIDAQVALGLPVDGREYAAAVAILDDLGITQVRLLTNNPHKLATLTQAGLTVEREPSHVGATPHNAAYLDAKRSRLGHLFDAPALTTIPQGA